MATLPASLSLAFSTKPRFACFWMMIPHTFALPSRATGQAIQIIFAWRMLITARYGLFTRILQTVYTLKLSRQQAVIQLLLQPSPPAPGTLRRQPPPHFSLNDLRLPLAPPTPM